MVNILRVDGAQLEGIHYLRAFGNSDAIRDDVAAAEHVVLIGGSYIAAEVAASLTAIGKRCTMVRSSVVLSRGFGEEVGGWFHDAARRPGRRDVTAARRSQAFEGDERVETVLTESGREIDCDAVVVGAGVRPDTMLAAAGRARGRRRDRLRLRASRLGARGSSPPATAPASTARSTAAGCGSSTGTSRCSRAGTPPAGCSATSSPTASCPTSSATSPTGRALEYVGRPPSWDEVIWRGDRKEASSRPGTCAADRVVARPLGRPLPRTSSPRGALHRDRARRSARSGRSSPTADGRPRRDRLANRRGSIRLGPAPIICGLV